MLKNPRTGYPIAKPSSIKRTEQEIKDYQNSIYSKEQLLEIAMNSNNANGAAFAIEQYRCQITNTIPLEGELAYKKGDWDIAEEKWSSCIYFSADCINSLIIMYRKQKRFKDEIDLLKYFIGYWQLSKFNVYNGSTDDYQEKLKKVSLYYEKHENEDRSKGISLRHLQYDKSFVNHSFEIYNNKCNIH